jgi:hypothetical protein
MADASTLRLRIFDGSFSDCVIVEPDMEYCRDLAAHIILEVIPNGLTHTLTNPTEVYVLRWIAGRTAGVPDFAPIYTIT